MDLNDMEIEYVTSNEIDMCGSLFLPETVKNIKDKESVIALTVSAEDTVIGGIAGYMEEGMFRISSLYVSPDWRRMGAGRLLVESLDGILNEDGIGMVIDFTVTEKEHETMCPFLEAMGFVNETNEEENIYLFTLKDIEESSFFARAKGLGTSFAQIDESVLHRADREAIANMIPRPACGLDGADVEKECSVAVVRGGEIVAYIAFDHSCMGRLTLAAMWVKDTETSGMLLGLLRSAFLRIGEIYPSEKEMAVQAVSPSSAALVKRLIPAARPVSLTYYLL